MSREDIENELKEIGIGKENINPGYRINSTGMVMLRFMNKKREYSISFDYEKVSMVSWMGTVLLIDDNTGEVKRNLVTELHRDEKNVKRNIRILIDKLLDDMGFVL